MTLHLSNPFDESWRHSLAYPMAGLSASTVLGWLTSPQIAAVASAIALGITTVGGALMGLVHQHKLNRIKLEMKEIELEMLRRKLHELPAQDLRPEEIAREAGDKCDGTQAPPAAG